MASPIRVLYVEDDPRFGGVIERELERCCDRISVTTERCVADGLERLANENSGIDCILSEYELPDSDGVDFLEQVRDEYPDLPFFLVTAHGSEAIASDAIAAGVTHYTRKGDDGVAFRDLAHQIETSVSEYRATREADQTRRRLRELTESTTDCLWIFDRDWEELLFISGYEEIWGRSAEQIRQDPQDFLDGVHPDDRSLVKDAMARLSAGDTIDIEYRILKGDDETGWVWVKGEPVFDDDGTVVRVVGFTRDVTDRKQRQRNLELRNQAMNEAPVGIVITDPDQEDNPVIYANDHFVALTGYTREEILGRNCRFLQGPETSEDSVAMMRDAIDEDEPVTVELRNYRTDGAVFWNRVSIAPVSDESGAVTNYIGFQENITGRRQRQQQLQIVDRILRHNLRNDLNVIRCRAEQLTSWSDPGVTSAASDILDQVDELMQMAEKERLIAQLLTEPVQHRTADLGSLLERVISSVQDRHPDATLTLDYPRDSSQIPEQIEHAVEELLVNAVEHSESTRPQVAVTVSVAESSVSITVTDDGQPIPEMERDVLLGREESPLYHGSGLGLWLVHVVTSRVNGSVAYEANEPRGNSVELVLPTK